MAPSTHSTVESDARATLREFIYARGLLAIEERKHRYGMAELSKPQNALAIAEFMGKTLDPWQREVIDSPSKDKLILVTRQGGKGEVTSLLALDNLINKPGSTTVITARSDRQALRLLRRIKSYYRQLNDVPQLVIDSRAAVETEIGSEILALPGSEETIRGIEAVDLLLIDEAALTPDELFAAVYPMLATTNGDCVAMTTPRGKRGWFYKEWISGSTAWHRTKITWRDIPSNRMKPEFIERTRRRLGDYMFRQEFECDFMDAETQLYATELVMAALRPAGQTTGALGLPTLGGDTSMGNLGLPTLGVDE